jgi:hypothetical protein
MCVGTAAGSNHSPNKVADNQKPCHMETSNAVISLVTYLKIIEHIEQQRIDKRRRLQQAYMAASKALKAKLLALMPRADFHLRFRVKTRLLYSMLASDWCTEN